MRDFHRVIGVEARRQILERAGRLPDAVAACVGGGSNAIGLFHAFLPDEDVRLVGFEAAGHGVDSGEHAATLTVGRARHPARLALLRPAGRRGADHRAVLDLGRPGLPGHRPGARLPEGQSGAASTAPSPTTRRCARCGCCRETEGIIPAIESAHALAGALDLGRELGPDGLVLVEPLRARRQGHGHAPRATSGCTTRRADKRAEQAESTASGSIELLNAVLATARGPRTAPRSSAICPAGFPTVDGGIAACIALLESGCDVVEVGLPHSDPVLDGPVIQTADDIALRGGVRIADVIRTVRDAHAATGKPVLCMTYWNPVDRYGVERFAAELAEAGGAGCILPDLPVEESEAWRKAAEQHGLATVFVVAPSSKDERLAKITAAGSGFVYAASLMGVTGTRESVGARRRTWCERTRATTRAAGLRRARRLQRRTGRGGRRVRGRRDRRLRLRQAAAGRRRTTSRPGRRRP